MDTITLTTDKYEELIDARDHAIAMRNVASGEEPLLNEEQLQAYLDAPSPIAFWRKHRSLNQKSLAELIGVSQPYLAQLEGGKRIGDIHLYARLAKALAVRIEDLLAE
jgi:DNA-binding XRE family transcriptional regulator